MAMGDDKIVGIKTRKPLSEAQREARRKGTARSKQTNNKPASGHDASGIPALGEGYGGPANGCGTPFSADHQPSERRGPRTPEELLALADEALDKMVNTMRNSKSDYVQATIAERVRNQIVGTPVQRIIADRQPIAMPGAIVAVFPKAVNGG